MADEKRCDRERCGNVAKFGLGLSRPETPHTVALHWYCLEHFPDMCREIANTAELMVAIGTMLRRQRR